jgi:hypothetical protein
LQSDYKTKDNTNLTKITKNKTKIKCLANKNQETMKAMNLIFTALFALCALMALCAVIFCNALHQLPVFALCALMAVTAYNSDKETKQQQ